MAATPFADGFHERLRDAREAAGLTQRELGAEAGVNYSQVSRYEQGIAHPRPGVLRRMANVLGVLVEYLRDGSDPGVTVEVLVGDGKESLARFAITSDMAKGIEAHAKHRGIPVEEMLKIVMMEGAELFAAEKRAKRKR